MINGTLKDTTPMTMSRDLDKVGSDGIVDELIVLGHQLVQALLDNLPEYQPSATPRPLNSHDCRSNP
jgi:hypothetical protein